MREFLYFSLTVFASLLYSPAAIRAQQNELTFTVASGLAVEKVADQSLVKWPILADWDMQGRLLVVESAGVAKPIEKHNEQQLHRIVRLIDDNGDGVFDRRIVAADKLPFTEGVLCLGQDLLITAPPHIWKLTDADDDGYCETRQIWFDGQTITGCANDLHGPYLGRDGWIYWCKGAFAKQNHALISGRTLSDGAAHIHRRREFGLGMNVNSTAIESVMSGGMDNPVDVASLPNGERFFTSTFLVHPGDGKRDGVAHAVYGGAYGKDHAALTGVVRTGPLMPIMTHMGAAAPSGLTCLESDKLLPAGRQTLVATLFNMQKVVGLALQPNGATYQATPIDLMVGSRIDFHPTDVIEDADGSLIVVDTGGWYDLCCPTSRVDQFTAPGGIYRIKRADQKSSASSTTVAIDWQNVDASTTVQLLNDSRPWIARKALIKIASSGDWAVDKLIQLVKDATQSERNRVNALWALGSTGTEHAMQWITEQIRARPADEVEAQLEQIACSLISLNRYPTAKSNLEKLIGRCVLTKQWSTARIAVEALGKIGDEESVQLLMSLAGANEDRFLDHSVRFALYELEQTSVVAKYLSDSNSDRRKLALSTLDLLQAKEQLTADVLTSAARDAAVAEVAMELLAKRPELADEVLSKLLVEWKDNFAKSSPTPLFEKLAASWRDQPAWQKFVAQAIPSASGEKGWQWKEVLLKSRAGTHLPPVWFDWIRKELNDHPEQVAKLLESCNLSAGDQAPIVEHVLSLVHKQTSNEAKRQLLVSLPAKPVYEDTPLLQSLTSSLTESIAASQSLASTWKCLKRMKLSRESAEQVQKISDKLPPTDLVQAIEVVSSLRDDALDIAMLDQLTTFKAARAIPTSSLINLYRDRSDSVKNKAKKVADQLLQSDPQTKQTVQALLSRLPAGDPIRGLTLYHSTKANCGACHQMGYRGGKIGPELSKIGSARTAEALLEAILFPSQRIEQGFETVSVLVDDGRVLNGIVTAKSARDMTMRIAADKLETIPLDSIESQRPSDVSIMPAGMMELLSEQELADLLSLLQAAK